MRERADRIGGPRQQTERRQILCETLGPQIEHECRFERGQRQLAHAQRALHRVLAYAADRRLAADDQARLRTAKQLVAGEGDDIAAGGQHLLRQWLARQAVVRQVDQRAAAQVGGERHATRMRNGRQHRFVDRRGEALHHVVARVHLHHEGGVLVDGALVVGGMRAVGGADFDHAGARARHHVGHAKGAPDFDQLTTRDDHFALAGSGTR